MPFERVREVSELQAEVWNLLITGIEENGFQPSMSEMAEALGISKGAVRHRILQLASKGVIELPAKYQDRCIRIRNVKFKAVFEQEG